MVLSGIGGHLLASAVVNQHFRVRPAALLVKTRVVSRLLLADARDDPRGRPVFEEVLVEVLQEAPGRPSIDEVREYCAERVERVIDEEAMADV